MSNAPLQLVPRLTGTTGERIKSARLFRRMTQDEMLAAMRAIDPDNTPKTRKTYGGWENDHEAGVTVTEIKLVAKATAFPVEDFVSDFDEGPSPDGTPATQDFPQSICTQPPREGRPLRAVA